MSRSTHAWTLGFALALGACGTSGKSAQQTKLFLDEHHVDPAGLSLDGVAAAHQKDLAAEGALGVDYQRYWVDTKSGTIFCLVRAPSAQAAADVHRTAHGLMADEIREVQPGILPAAPSGKRLFMDTHEVGPGLRAADVAEAHKKDLAVQAAHGVRFLEYWVDEAGGRIHCLVEAPDAEAAASVHREAHGLLADSIFPVAEGV